MKIRKLLYDTFESFFFSVIYFLCSVLSIFSREEVETHCIDRDINELQVSFAGDIGGKREYIMDSLENNILNVISYCSKGNEEITSIGGNFFVNIATKKNFAIKFNNIKIGYICVDCLERDLHIKLLKKYINMKKLNTDMVYLYLCDIDISPALIKKLAQIGFDGILCVGKKHAFSENKGYRSIKKTHIYTNLDGYLQLDNVVAPYNVLISQSYYKHHKTWQISKQGFVVSSSNIDNFDKVIEGIENMFRDLPEWGQFTYFNELSEAIGLKLPHALNYLENFASLNICARIAEVGPNSVFFFRQPLKHNNDKWRILDLFYFRIPIIAFLRGASLVVSYKKLPRFIPHVVVEDSIEAHIKAIDWYRNKKYPNVRSICITGSIGKTTTKDMLFSVLSKGYNTGKSELNTNVQAKIGINMQRLSHSTEVFIQEIGGGRPGGASKHARMVNPEYAVITNIGTAHIGNFKSKDELFLNKLAIVEGLKPEGVLFLNGDDEWLLKAETPFKQVYFSVNNKDSDYYVQNIEEKDGAMSFDIVSKDEVVRADLNVSGLHNILNAVCCFAIGKTFGMNNEDIIEGLRSFRTADSRQNVITIGKLKVIADCYNASYESVLSSLELLNQVSPSDVLGKKVAVLGDITGLGKEKKNIYAKLATKIEQCGADEVIFYTNEEKEISQMFQNKAILLHSPSQLLSWLDNNIEDSDVVLFKGSSKARLDEILDSFLGLDISDTRYFEESKCVKASDDAFSYDVFEKYATVTKYYGADSVVKVDANFYGKNIKKIKHKAFKDNDNLKSIHLPTQVIYIGEEAFMNCHNLKEVMNLDTVRSIDKSAFYNNTSLQNISFGERLLSISENAFAECHQLREITIPESVLHIGENAFKNCYNLERVYIKGNVAIDINAFNGCNKVKIVDDKDLHKEVI